MKMPRFGKVKELAQGYAAGKWWRGDLNLGLCNSRSHSLFTLPHSVMPLPFLTKDVERGEWETLKDLV